MGKHVKSNENLDHVVNKKIEEFVVTASRFLKVQNIVSGQRKWDAPFLGKLRQLSERVGIWLRHLAYNSSWTSSV